MTTDRKPLLGGFMPWLSPRPAAKPAPAPASAPTAIAVAERPKGEAEPMNEHIVKSYEEELALLDRKIAQMGGLAEHILGQSFDALERRDPQLAEQVVKSDKQIDQLERDI